MSEYDFFYADVRASLALINQYSVDEWVHANNGVVASKLRGGLLTGCNIRFSFVPTPYIKFTYRQEDMDYKNLQMYIFEEDLYFRVLDKYQVGDKAQILMSPFNNIQEYPLEDIIEAARNDFKSLYKTRPVAALDNMHWKRKVAKVPGVDGKNSPKKGFLTDY